MVNGFGTKKSAILFVIFSAIFTSTGQILWKFGVGNIDLTLPLTLINLPFVLGFVSYGIGALFMILAFQQGELSVIYPILATSYVWVTILSPIFFPTDFLNGWKIAGVAIILIAVSLLGFGNAKNAAETYG